jgi:hypothetical protein
MQASDGTKTTHGHDGAACHNHLVGIVQAVCFRAECDSCGFVLTDYGAYQGMESPRAAAEYAVEQAGWGWAHQSAAGDNRIYLWCPQCVTAGRAKP